MSTLLEAMTGYVRRQRDSHLADADRPTDPVATGHELIGYRTGYCDTCGWSEVVVRINCTDSNGAGWYYIFWGDFPEFITELTKSEDLAEPVPPEHYQGWFEQHEDELFLDTGGWPYGWHRA